MILNNAFSFVFAGLIFSSLSARADITEGLPANLQEDATFQDALDAYVVDVKAAENNTNLESKGHYVERLSYGTQKETDPPRYVKPANKTWLNNDSFIKTFDWLDLGLEYRVRYEYRDNDFRRRDENLDQPILLRSRAYVGVKNILDPLRFAIELQDSRRNNSDYTREYDTRDINYLHILQGYLELNFKQSFFGKDDLGNERPIWIRAGRHAWESIDRRLIARNEWRNTTNNFQGLRANIGDKKNDWQIELFSVQPIQRFTHRNDQVDDSKEFYGVIGDYRGWSDYVTLEPYYLLLKQAGDKVKYDTDGRSVAEAAKVDRTINTGGLRLYGLVPNTQLDYDASYIQQWGNIQRLIGGRYITVSHDAHAYNAEIGYRFLHQWNPRLSVFYGVATGDKTTSSGSDRSENERFDRLFGFARPWSNNDYIQMENIRTPKIRLEFEPNVSLLGKMKVDTGFSWYQLDSASDRWNAGGDLRDKSGRSGREIGKEYDVRIRFSLGQYASINLGYARFWAGSFLKNAPSANADNINNFTQNRSADSNFFYSELTLLGF